jgi:hypothetical protein
MYLKKAGCMTGLTGVAVSTVSGENACAAIQAEGSYIRLAR